LSPCVGVWRLPSCNGACVVLVSYGKVLAGYGLARYPGQLESCVGVGRKCGMGE